MKQLFEPLIGPTALLIVFLAAVPFGSNLPWAWVLFAFLIGLVLLAQLYLDLTDTANSARQFRQLGIAPWLFLIVCLWMAYQSSGLPPAALHHPIYSELPDSLNAHAAISIIPQTSQLYLLRLLTYIAVFWIIFRSARTRSGATRLLYFCCIAISFMALYTLWTYVTGRYQTNILWLPHTWSGTAPTGTFTNQNHLGTFLSIGAIISVGLGLSALPNSQKMTRLSFAQKARLVAAETNGARLGFSVIVFVLLFGTTLLTDSRGAIAVLTLSSIGFVLLFLSSRQSFMKQLWRRAAQTNLLLLASLLFVIGLGAFGLFLSAPVQAIVAVFDPFRPIMIDATLTAIKSNIMWGSGAGTFMDAFAPFKGEAGTQNIVANAHNTYLQLVLELGLPVALLFYFGITVLIAITIRGIGMRKRDKWMPQIGIVLLTYAAIHSLIDFSYEVPAVSALFTAVIAITIAQTQSSRS